MGRMTKASLTNGNLHKLVHHSPVILIALSGNWNLCVSSAEVDTTIVQSLEVEKSQQQKLEPNGLRKEIEEEIRAIKDADEREILQLRMKLEKVESERDIMLQSMQEFRVMVDFWKNAILKSADDCLVKLKVETCGTRLEIS